MRKNNTLRNMGIAAMVGGMTVAGYMYMKQNPNIMKDIKKMMKDMELQKFKSLDEDV